VDIARRARVDGRVEGRRNARAARVHARFAAQAGGVRQVHRFQNERGSATGRYMPSQHSYTTQIRFTRLVDLSGRGAQMC